MAYISTNQERARIKMDVLKLIAPGASPIRCGRELYEVDGTSIHARFCSACSANYKFNINPNSLRAQYELWICGDASQWYLIPIAVALRMYQHQGAYVDNHHPEIRVVSVSSVRHRAIYASPGVTLDLSPYFRSQLPRPTS